MEEEKGRLEPNTPEFSRLLDRDFPSVKGVKDKELIQFIHENTTKPSGTLYGVYNKYSLISVAAIGNEQGEWSAAAALKILAGTSPKDIPVIHSSSKIRFSCNTVRIETNARVRISSIMIIFFVLLCPKESNAWTSSCLRGSFRSYW